MTPIARTTGGKVSGREKEGVLLFAGIPFAVPPKGPRRFKAPEPHDGWDGVREAKAFGAVSVQLGDSLGSVGLGTKPEWSEDCLFLNVQTPALDDGGRPVMVWIHGGAFVNGTGAIPWYDGSKFVKRGDVVVVTINYRLGALGWLSLGRLGGEYATSANNGLLDQILALRWVRDNIAEFGGDPDAVTIFGESAGAMSVATLLGTPKASGLFGKAIAQSGAAHNVCSADDAAVVTDAFLAELDGDVEALLRTPPERILEVQSTVSLALTTGRLSGRSTSASGIPFGPVVDGSVISRSPYEEVVQGLSSAVPLLVGTNRDEWNLFGLMAPPVRDEDHLLDRVSRVVPDPVALIASYRSAFPGDDPGELFGRIMTDRVFRMPAVRLAEAQAAHQPDNTFLYLFEFASTAFGGALGACHALEIPFVFDNLHKQGVEMLTGESPPERLAVAMHGAWSAFARTGVPRTEVSPNWPAYGPGRRQTMLFGKASTSANPTSSEPSIDQRAYANTVVEDPDAIERSIWEGLM